MKTIAVILSDLHLGSTRSIVDREAAPGVSYSEYIEKLLFSKLTPSLRNGKAKYLILNGDTFDFSLQDYQQVFESAAMFFKEVARSNLFEQIILNIGNHDHNVWQLLQHEVMVVRRLEHGRPPLPYPYIQSGVLKLEDGTLNLPGVDGSPGEIYLKGLFQLNEKADAPLPRLPIAVVYPNLFLVTKENPSRPMLVTHGHFFCLPWILLTEILPRALGIEKGFRLDELEQINSPLTELGWTALGQAGKLTTLVNKIYDEGFHNSTNTVEAVLDELARYLDEMAFRYYPFDPRELLSDVLIKFFNSVFKKAISGKIVKSEAHKGDNLFLNDDFNRKLINKYIGMSRAQYSKLVKDNITASIPDTLIFGHTHVPIPPGQGTVGVLHQGTQYQVNAMNTGGFMPDTEGAAAIGLFINEDGTISSTKIWSREPVQIYS